MTGRVAKVLLCALVAAACGGGEKSGAKTTPSGGKGKGSSSDSTSMQDTGTPTYTGGGSGSAATGGGSAGGPNANGATPGLGDKPEPPVVFPNQDPDPAQAKAAVDQQLAVAKAALAAQTPDGDGALRAAKEALKIDAANVDAAAYIAYAYYAKKQYDTAELVLDELFKRPTAKNNATVYYVYGLVYDHTNRPEQAVLAFQKAVELDPNMGSALVDLGVHQLQNKQYALAQETFTKLTKPPFSRADAVTLTSLGSAYRGVAGDYPAGSSERNSRIPLAEATYKRALTADPNYGPAYYDLGLLYLDFDPFPSGGGNLDAMQRLAAAEDFLNKYKNMPGVDLKLYDERMKDVTKAKKRAQKAAKKKGG